MKGYTYGLRHNAVSTYWSYFVALIASNVAHLERGDERRDGKRIIVDHAPRVNDCSLVEQLDVAKDTIIAILTTSGLLITLISSISSYSSVKPVGWARTILFYGSVMFLMCVLFSVTTLGVVTADAADDTRKLSRGGRLWFVFSCSSFIVALCLLVLVLALNVGALNLG
jgi:hypothetical protein